jgi:alpha-beta hydrolase superfamily lysophospholipase
VRRKWRKIGVTLVGVVVVGTLMALWVMAGSMARPDRREIQEYHKSYLDGACDHGLVVARYDFVENAVPCLVVRPEAKAGAAKRGSVLRRQLEDQGMVLPVYGEERGLLVLLHGRNGRKEDLLPVAERFCAVGFICVIPDLSAHGESPVERVGFGVREFEKKLPSRVAEEAERELGLGTLPRFLWGMSMGGSFAVYAAEDDPRGWEKSIVVASFDRLGGVVEDSLGFFSRVLKPVAVKMIEMRGGPKVEEVAPVELAERLTLPTLVIHGDEDDLISYERGESFFAALGGRKKFVTVPGGSHDNVLVTEAPVYAEMARWLLGP